MEMTANEIVTKYNRAEEKKEQITILSQLNGCDEDTIRKILTDNGVVNLPKKKGRRTKAETERHIEQENHANSYIQGEITGGKGDIVIPQLKTYRTAEELIREPEDMTDEEKERLVRIRAIPKLVRILVQTEIGRITEEIMEWERQRDALIDYLNGEDRNE